MTDAVTCPGGSSTLPRSIERGPVEAAARQRVKLPQHPLLPRSIERGPVEALRSPCQTIRRSANLPRSIERGPVEAWTARNALSQGFCAFRAQLSAAPLKPGAVPAAGGSGMGLPRSIERGPVEATNAVWNCGSGYGPSALN